MPNRSPNPKWTQPNNSDKFGSIYRSKNINLDQHGYLKLSPRMVRLYSQNDDANLGLPIAIGKQSDGEFQVTTDDANWGVDLAVNSKSVAEDTGSSNPNPTIEGDGVWFSGLWHVSTDTTVVSRPATGGASQAYTSRITGLTSGKRHRIVSFKNRRTICVTDGNTVVQKDDSYSASTTLTIPADYEITSIAYNNQYVGIGTRLVNDGTQGQDQEALFFVWKGATTSADNGVGVGSDAVLDVRAYKSSFVLLTRAGELLYWNGGGFQQLAVFPFFFTDHIYGDAQDNNALGNVYMEVDGDNILINIGNELNIYGRNADAYADYFPAGVWCFDPSAGLYHRSSPSNSPIYLFTVTDSNVNTTTDVLTISSGTVPATGNVARLISTVGIGGLEVNTDYYIIKTGATTMKLATTREEALAGVSIDLTSATAGSNYFWVLNHIDYGATKYDSPGAVKLVGNAGNSAAMFTDIIVGARLFDTDMSNNESLCIGVPWFENRGYIVTPKHFSPTDTSTPVKFTVRFQPLNSDSSILVYGRSRDVFGVNVSTLNLYATYTDPGNVYTTRDLSDIEDYINSGGDVLAEIINGVGAGQLVRVSAVTCSSGTCAVAFAEDVFGVTAGDKCNLSFSNFALRRTITSADNIDGEVSFSLDLTSTKFAQFLVEMRGYDIIIEDIAYADAQHK